MSRLTTSKTPDGEWRVNGLPFVIAKGPYTPRWGERQEWLICDAADTDRVLAAGYQSKAHALDMLETILEAARQPA